jgi:hypothetical protein
MGGLSRARPRQVAAAGPDRSPQPQIFRREGDYWTIVYGGATVRVRDGVGMHYLAQLLAHPQQRFAAGELVAAVKGTAVVDGERARSAVSKRLRAAVARLAQYDARLGYHLGTTIKTGYFCVYLPDPTRSPAWSVEGPWPD